MIKFITVRMDEEQKRLAKIKKLRDTKVRGQGTQAAAAAAAAAAQAAEAAPLPPGDAGASAAIVVRHLALRAHGRRLRDWSKTIRFWRQAFAAQGSNARSG